MTDPTATVTADDYYAIIPEWLLDTASPRAIQVYGFLRRYADKDSLEGRPSRATLAKRARCSRNTIDRALRELVDIGALTVTPRFDDNGDRTSNLYHLHRMPIGGPTNGDTPSTVHGATPVPTSGAQNYSPSVPQSEEPQLATTSQSNGDYQTRMKDALVAACGWNPAEVTSTQWGAVEKAGKELRDINADPDDADRRAVIYRVNMPEGALLTPTALAKHWAECAEPNVPLSKREVARAADRQRARDMRANPKPISEAQRLAREANR